MSRRFLFLMRLVEKMLHLIYSENIIETKSLIEESINTFDKQQIFLRTMRVLSLLKYLSEEENFEDFSLSYSRFGNCTKGFCIDDLLIYQESELS